MKILVNVECFSNNMAEEIRLQTGKSFLIVSSIDYRAEENRILFELERNRLLSVQHKFGLIENPEYEADNKVKTKIEIRNVQAVSIDNQLTATDQKFQLYRGIIIDQNRIFLASVEESDGKFRYEIEIAVSRLNICMEDV